MKMWVTGALLLSAVQARAVDVNFDKQDKLEGITVESGKVKGVRVYRGSFERVIKAPLAVVKAGITNFSEKCNDKLRDKREWVSRDTKCAFKNENMIETKQEGQLLKSGEGQYVLSRHGYNRGAFEYHELITEVTTDSVVTIRQEMLTDSEAKQWLKSPLKNTSAFERMSGVFELTQLSPTETKLKYEYRAETTHWLLNKEITVPQVFAGMSRGINDLWKSIEGHSSQHRQVASQQH